MKKKQELIKERNEYYKKIKPFLNEYKRKDNILWKEYEKKPILDEFMKKEEFIWKEYKKKIKPFLNEYEKKKKEIEEKFEDKCSVCGK